MHKRYDTLPNKVDETTYRIDCVQCGKTFESQRDDAAFCGSTCRSRAHRRQKNRQANIDKTLHYLNKMLDTMPRRGDSPEFTACNTIIRRVSYALNNVGS